MAITRITKGVIKPNENYDTHNIVSTGIVTSVGLDVNGNADISGSLSVGGVLTYEDVTSIDSVGIITARTGLVSPYADIDDFVSVGSNIHLGNAGVVTATSFVGSGAALTGIDATAIKDSGGNVKVQAQASGAMYTGIHTFSSGAEVGSNIKLGNAGVITATSFVGSGAALTGIDATAVKDSGGNVKIQAQASGAVYTGIHTFGTNTNFTDIDVDGHTNLDNLNIAGVSTFAGTLNASTVSSTAFIASGDLDVDGHTNLDNVSIAGVTTASGNINMGGGNLIFGDSGGDSDDKLVFGAGSDFKIFHNGSNNYIDVAGNGHLYIRPKANFYIQDYTNGEVWIDGALNGGVQLYNNGSLKLATDGNGITVQGNINMATDSTLQLGVGNDFKLFHNGTTNYIRSANGTIQIDNNSGVPNAQFIPGQGTKLYYGASVKFTTETSGVNITGIVTATSADINGDLDVSGNLNLDYRLIHTGDADTYMEFPAANRIRFATANQDRLEIREDGRIVTHGYDGDRFIFNHDMGHGARNVQIYAVGDTSTWHSFVGTNLTHDGTNYIKPSDNGNQNWGNISGIVFEGASNASAIAMRFVVDVPGDNGLNYSLGAGNSGKTAAIENKTAAFFNAGGDFIPGTNNTYNLGTTAIRWKNLYVNDLQLSNEAKKDTGGNDVDGTWGDWTLQEGEDKVYMINNRTGKKYSLKMEEE